MNKDLLEKKKLYEEMLDFGLFGSLENYSMSTELFKRIYKKEKIAMDDYIQLWRDYLPERRGLLSLYVHIPYCVERCYYCVSCSSKLKDDSQLEECVEKLLTYFDFFSPKFEGQTFDNFYMGGGNPSILSAKLLDRLLDGVFSNFDFSEEGEKTVENDPRTTSFKKMEVLKKHGINRISIGVQSLSEEVLQKNNRLMQSEEKVRRAIQAADKVGFKAVNVDLMIGLYGDDEKTFLESFQKLAEMDPDEFSLYSLQPVRGYLEKIYQLDRKTFYKKRKEFYDNVISEVEEWVVGSEYHLPHYSEMSKDFNDADSIKIKKKDLDSFETSYASRLVNRISAVLGIGYGAESLIPGKAECFWMKELTEDPNDYFIYASPLDEESQLVKDLINIVSNRNKLYFSKLEENHDSRQVDKIKKIFKEIEKNGAVEIEGDLVEFNFNGVRDKFLHSLLFFDENKVVDLIPLEKSTSDKDDQTSSKLKKELSEKQELLKEEGKAIRVEGVVNDKREDFLEIILDSDETMEVKVDKETLVVESILDLSNDFQLIENKKIGLNDLKEEDSLNVHFLKDERVAVLIQKFTAIYS